MDLTVYKVFDSYINNIYPSYTIIKIRNHCYPSFIVTNLYQKSILINLPRFTRKKKLVIDPYMYVIQMVVSQSPVLLAVDIP